MIKKSCQNVSEELQRKNLTLGLQHAVSRKGERLRTYQKTAKFQKAVKYIFLQMKLGLSDIG